MAGRKAPREIPTIGGAVRTAGTFGTAAPPGNTTLPKLRVTPGVVAAVPPGNTTLPKLRVTVWAATPNARNRRATKPAAALMGLPPYGIVHPNGARTTVLFLLRRRRRGLRWDNRLR